MRKEKEDCFGGSYHIQQICAAEDYFSNTDCCQVENKKYPIYVKTSKSILHTQCI